MIVNLTPYPATPEQIAAGVIDMNDGDLIELLALHTFDAAPTAAELTRRAKALVELIYDMPIEGSCSHVCNAMLGGAPYFMPALEKALKDARIQPMYSFPRPVDIDAATPTISSRHAGWVMP